MLAVHLFGRPVDWEESADGSAQEVALVEDAAGALGARYRGRPCGSLGAMGCLSFHPRKIVTTGEGGAVTTDDAELADAVRRLRHHGIVPRGDFDIPQPGLNYRLPDLLCAIGIPQLARLEELLAARERVGRRGTRSGSAGVVELPVGGRGRPPRLAGVRRPARPPRRGARVSAGGGDRGADRHLRAAPPDGATATRARFPARTLRSRGRWRCRSPRR